MSNAIRESRYRTSFSNTKFFFDCDEILDFKSRRCFCARAKSSEISKSRSLADIDRYKAVTDIRLDWRSDRVSCDDIVFCRATG